MSGFAVRFIHASDLHLELPLFGVADVPPHLGELFVDAPFRAAQNVFDAVLSENAHFLVLAGDVIKLSQAGPRGLLFLREQFLRLAERDIPVYWAGSRIDPIDDWPAALPLPENVYLFPTGEPLNVMFQREGLPPVELVGVSRGPRKLRSNEFRSHDQAPLTIAVAYGQIESGITERMDIDYWALGGAHRRSELPSRRTAMHYSGTPQGRMPGEVGPHGCTLVEIDVNQNVDALDIATDQIRWIDEHIAVDAQTDVDDVPMRMRGQLEQQIAASQNRHLLVSWNVSGAGPTLRSLLRGHRVADILAVLRSEFDGRVPVAWPVSVNVQPPATMPESWYQEETIRGELLRNVRRLQHDPSAPLDLVPMLGEGPVNDSLATAVRLTDSSIREQRLRHAAALGTDLLRGEL